MLAVFTSAAVTVSTDGAVVSTVNVDRFNALDSLPAASVTLSAQSEYEPSLSWANVMVVSPLNTVVGVATPHDPEKEIVPASSLFRV